MDKALLSLMEAAEKGLTVPQIYAWTGGLVVTGRPISAEECWERLQASLMVMKPETKRDIWSGTVKKVSPQVEAKFDEQVQSLGEPEFDPGVLNLGGVNVFTPGNGETVSVAAVRVPVPMINAWFTGHYKSKSSGPSFFVGAFLPLDP